MKSHFKIVLFFLLEIYFSSIIHSQNSSNILDILVKKNQINQREADSMKTQAAFDEKVNSQNKNFTIGLEFRPRIEFRNGYKQLPNDTTKAAFFGTQRSRLYFNYSQPKFKFHTSIQDLRVWGQYGQTSSVGSLNVFESYVDAYLTENLFFRLGRQKVELDNGRLFSAANWSQAGRAHDGINLIYSKSKVSSELMCFFNQTTENVFGTNFSPTTFSNYKSLQVHYLKLKLPLNLSLTTINSADGFQSKTTPNTLYVRGNSGGRLEFEKGRWYVTMSGYYQYGQLQSGQKIDAYYLQPEIQFKTQKITTRLGMEYMSGDNSTKTSSHSQSFIPLYGVAWKFMGNMDYFTSFPNDTKKGGLINPYLFISYNINKKLSIRVDSHLFYSQNKVIDNNKNVINPYLGFENDLSCKFQANDFTTIEYGFSYMIASKSMEFVRGGNSVITPVWSYLMITFKPEVFSSKW